MRLVKEPAISPRASPIARAILQRMRAKGLTAKEVSERAGLAPGYLFDLFRGKTIKPGAEALAAIAAVLDCNINDLLDSGRDGSGRDSPQQQPPNIALPIEVAGNRVLILQLWDVLSDREQAELVSAAFDIIKRRKP